jgi:hypothetical protein
MSGRLVQLVVEGKRVCGKGPLLCNETQIVDGCDPLSRRGSLPGAEDLIKPCPEAGRASRHRGTEQALPRHVGTRIPIEQPVRTPKQMAVVRQVGYIKETDFMDDTVWSETNIVNRFP